MSETDSNKSTEPVSVTILGQTIFVKSQEGEEAVRRVTANLEERIEDIRKASGTVDTLRLLLYAACQMADENVKIKGDLSRLEEEVDVSTTRMLEELEAK